MRAPLLLFVCAGGTVAEVIPSPAHAQDAVVPTPVVATSGTCPDSSSVQRVLAGLLPSNAAGPTTAASVSDLGDSYVVTIGDRVKTYVDAGRDCAERARVAAAFITLALAPEVAPLPETKPPQVLPVAPSPPAPTPAPTRAIESWIRVDGRGTYSAGGNGLFAPGVALGIAAGHGRFGGQAVCAWVAPSSISAAGGGGSIAVERFPCALGPTLRISTAAPLDMNTSVGVVLGALLAQGTGFASSYGSTRLEVGVRLALDATLHVSQNQRGFAPVLGLEAIYDPVTYDLEVIGRGVVGHTPPLWAGVSAGVSWGVP
jgi:hypothetical protein